jgi:hypothetical protein
MKVKLAGETPARKSGLRIENRVVGAANIKSPICG